jgi:hypothetical protein
LKRLRCQVTGEEDETCVFSAQGTLFSFEAEEGASMHCAALLRCTVRANAKRMLMQR